MGERSSSSETEAEVGQVTEQLLPVDCPEVEGPQVLVRILVELIATVSVLACMYKKFKIKFYVQQCNDLPCTMCLKVKQCMK